MENDEQEVQKFPDLLIPDGYPEIIFILEGAYSKRSLVAESQQTIVKNSSVIGIQLKSLLVKRVGKVRLLGIKFKPMGFYHLFEKKGVTAVDKTLTFRDFGMPFLLVLEGALKQAGTPENAMAVLYRELLVRSMNSVYTSKKNLVQTCIDVLLQTKGNCTLNDLSDHAQKGKRQLQRYFKECIGISPKQFSKLIRFKSVYKKEVLSDTSLGHFFDHGYFDQSHFIKEFRANLGVTPSHASSQKFKKQNEIAKKSSRS